MFYEDLVDDNFHDESSVALKLKDKETISSLKQIDKYYEKYTFPFYDTWTDGKYYKNITTQNYGSGTRGSLIRNAVSGLIYDIRVGSLHEDMLFKVTKTTGKRKEPLVLFYDSPEEYEKHYFTNVSDDIKKKWTERSLYVKKSLDM
jgi:hypothetical protein